jgi:outer membrane protein TolC
MAYQKVEMAKSMLQFTKGNLLPQVSVNASGGVKRFGLYTMDGAGNSTTEITSGRKVPVDLPDYYLGMQSSWELDFRGKLTNQKKAAMTKLLASEEGLKFVKTNIVSEVAYAYYNLIALDQELDIIEATTNKQKEALDYVKAQKESGKANELAVLQFSAQLHSLNMLEMEVRQQLHKTENQLNFLVGQFPQKIKRDKNGLSAFNTSLHAGLPSELLTNRPDIQVAALQLQALRFDVSAAKAAFLPSFNISSGIGFQAFNSAYLFKSPESMAYNLLGGLVAPLVNKSAIKSAFNYAKANEIEALAIYQQKVLNGFVEVTNGVNEIESLEQIQKIAVKKNIENINAVESALSLYKSARVPYLDVILTQQNALQSNLEQVDIARRIKLANISLYKSIGGVIN